MPNTFLFLDSFLRATESIKCRGVMPIFSTSFSRPAIFLFLGLK